jgi:hypothetical protein
MDFSKKPVTAKAHLIAKSGSFKRFIFLNIIHILLMGVDVKCQETHMNHETEKEPKNLITLSLGYTFIPSGAELESTEADGFFVPTLGMEYFYQLRSNWKLGLVVDWELGRYLILKEDLERERAFVVVPTVVFNLTHHLHLFTGIGAEIERNKNLVVYRFGLDYVIPLGKHWEVGPAFFYNVKEGYDAWSLSAAIGKKF